jgi:thiamine pyrophosphate-dependent acetolactate synthase large subunit-like protein
VTPDACSVLIHHRSPGPATAGVGRSFAIGAKTAKRKTQVIRLDGDGSFGQNAMELDTAARHKLRLLCVVSLNGGCTADPERDKPGLDLGYTRYDKMADTLGCYAEYVEEPEEIRPALQRAWRKGARHYLRRTRLAGSSRFRRRHRAGRC